MELDWYKFTQIADKFQYKAKLEDREDLKQDIIVKLAEVASNNGHELFNEGTMVRIASYVTMSYWRDIMRKPIMLKLNGDDDNDDGDSIELWQTLADNNAIDLEAWQDAKKWLLSCPKRLVKIAYKRYIGKPLDHKEQIYLLKKRDQELKKYQEVLTFDPSFGTI